MITIINERCEIGIPKIDDYSIDLIVTSPPYNVNLGHNKYNNNPYDLYLDNKEHREFISWLRSIFEKLYPKISIGGRICINIGDGKNGAVPTSSDIIQFMKDIKYIPLTHIIWNKSQIGNRTAWGSFGSASCPSFPTPFEHILVFCKENKKIQRMVGKTDLTKNEFIEWSLALWNFAPETKQKEYGHNAMFPEELPRRCIKMFTFTGSMVCDPFSGLGTTAVVCKKLGRNFIGFEISANYCRKSEERLKLVRREEMNEKVIDINEIIDENYKEPKKQLTIEDL